MRLMSEYLIDRILPRNRIHLIAGISSAGKTRWAIPTLMMFGVSMPVLGLKSNAVPWGIVCRDRPLADVEEGMAKMRLKMSDLTIIPACGSQSKGYGDIIAEIRRLKLELVLWEGFDLMVENINSQGEVQQFLNQAIAHCEGGLTIIGSTGVAKLKPHEMYQNPRQLVAGSSVWERMTSTDFINQPIDPANIEDPRRILYVSLKNDPSFAVGGKFDHNGVLVFDDYEHRERGAELAKAKGNERIEVWERLFKY